MRDLLFFDTMITPRIITIVYWLTLVGVVIAAVTELLSGHLISAVVTLIGGVIGARIWCELLIVLFKIHENLQKLANKP